MDSKTKETIERSKKWIEVLYPKKCKCGSHIREYQSECMKCTLTREFLPGEKIDFRKLLIKNIEPKETKMEKSELKIGNKYKHVSEGGSVVEVLMVGENAIFVRYENGAESSWNLEKFLQFFGPYQEDKFPHGEVVAHIQEEGEVHFSIKDSWVFNARERSLEWKMAKYSIDNMGQIQVIRG